MTPRGPTNRQGAGSCAKTPADRWPNLVEGLALSEFLSSFTGSARRSADAGAAPAARAARTIRSKRKFASCSSAGSRSTLGANPSDSRHRPRPRSGAANLEKIGRHPDGPRRTGGRGRPACSPRVPFSALEGRRPNAGGHRPRTVDILQGLPQVPAFGDLDAKAKDVEVDGLVVRICSYGHLVAMKRASGRPRDRDDLEAFEAPRNRG